MWIHLSQVSSTQATCQGIMQQVADTHLGAESNVFFLRSPFLFFPVVFSPRLWGIGCFTGMVILIRNIENMQFIGCYQGFIWCGVHYSSLAHSEHNFVQIGKSRNSHCIANWESVAFFWMCCFWRNIFSYHSNRRNLHQLLMAVELTTFTGH